MISIVFQTSHAAASGATLPRKPAALDARSSAARIVRSTNRAHRVLITPHSASVFGEHSGSNLLNFSLLALRAPLPSGDLRHIFRMFADVIEHRSFFNPLS